MRKFLLLAALAFVMTMLLLSMVHAETDHCITRGEPGHLRVYCDKGGNTYQYGNTVITPDGSRYHNFDGQVYGPGQERIGPGKGNAVLGGPNPGEKAIILHGIYGGHHHSGGDGGYGSHGDSAYHLGD